MAVINSNLLAISSRQNQNRAQSGLSTAMERLSSGLRVNSAKDDAAGQAIGNRMTAQIRGQNQAARNINDGLSLSQSAQAVLDQVNGKLQRIRELTVQGLNETLSNADHDAVQAEINLNLKEIDRLAKQSNYNGIPLLDGTAGKVNLQVGANVGETLDVDLAPPGFSVDELGLTDFAVYGVEGEVRPRETLLGYAKDIYLGDTDTTVTLSGTGTRENDPSSLLKNTGIPNSYATSLFHFYFKSEDSAGDPVYYRTSTKADHYTSTDLSTVNISSTSKLFPDVDKVAASYTPYINFTDENVSGTALDNASPRLLQAEDGRYLVEATDNTTGAVTYHEAELTFVAGRAGNYKMDASITGTASITGQPSTGFTPVTDIEGFELNSSSTKVNYSGSRMYSGTESIFESDDGYYVRTGYNQSPSNYYYKADVTDIQTTVTARAWSDTPTPEADFTSPPSEVDTINGHELAAADVDVKYLNSLGAPISPEGIYQSDNNYYIKALDSQEEPVYYRAHVTDETVIDIATQNDSVTKLDKVNYSPDIALPSTGEGVSFIDQSGENIPDNEVRLLHRSDNRYMIETTDATGNYLYQDANVKVVTGSQGDTFTITATGAPSQFEVANYNEEAVTGDSHVTLDPRNVTVDYTEADGNTSYDVLRKDADGQYYFNVTGGEQENRDLTYKSATLADGINGEVYDQGLIETLNGNGDVVVYYPRSASIITDANGFDNDGFNDAGKPDTNIRLREVNEEIRLKTPQDPLATLDRAIARVDEKRSTLGATENRLGSAIDNLTTSSINLTAARSRIMDADYAVESSNMVKSQILQQASTSMLAQANQVPQTVLSLLN